MEKIIFLCRGKKKKVPEKKKLPQTEKQKIVGKGEKKKIAAN